MDRKKIINKYHEEKRKITEDWISGRISVSEARAELNILVGKTLVAAIEAKK
jgi:hypothetical protein